MSQMVLDSVGKPEQLRRRRMMSSNGVGRCSSGRGVLVM
jgi:hypothetical protein